MGVLSVEHVDSTETRLVPKLTLQEAEKLQSSKAPPSGQLYTKKGLNSF